MTAPIDSEARLLPVSEKPTLVQKVGGQCDVFHCVSTTVFCDGRTSGLD